MSDPQPRVDALLPAEIAERAEELGVRKARASTFNLLALGILAGAFVSLGGNFATVAISGAVGVLPFGLVRVVFGLVFCLGLILIVVAGAELFTGNTLLVMALASGKIKIGALLRNWVIVYIGNLIGSLATALLIFLTKEHTFGGGVVGQTALTIANSKVNIEFGQAVALGIMCNTLVCLAVWLTMGARTTTDKILAILFPITAFAAAGFEHSIANMYFIPIGWLIKEFDPAFAAGVNLDLTNLTPMGFLNNLVPVTIGNIIGGAVLVAAAYWLVYRRDNHD